MTAEVLAGSWRLQPDGSRARFNVSNLRWRTVHGSIGLVEGKVRVDDAGSPVDATAELDLTSIATGNPRRDKDLRAPRFLDLERHPAMTFRSTSIEPDGNGWRVRGELALRGRTAPIELAVTRMQRDGVPVGCFAVLADGVLDRRPLGISAPSFMIGRMVSIEVEAVLTPLAPQSG